MRSSTTEQLNDEHSMQRMASRLLTEYFTGAVRIDSPLQAPETARAGGAIVTSSQKSAPPGGPNHLGQTVIDTSALAWVQREGAEGKYG
jgi:hypothetical protein